MREIPLVGTKGAGLVSLVDDAYFDYLSQFRWRLTQHGYVRRSYLDATGRTVDVRMHREIMGAEEGDVVDHINRNKLDNRRENLRIVDRQQSRMNTGPCRRTSQYKGLYYSKRDDVWTATIMRDGIKHYLGTFDTEEDAAIAYNVKAIELFGAYAYLNIVPGRTDDSGYPLSLDTPKRRPRNKTSRFRGVSLRKESGRYTAFVVVCGKTKKIGCFATEIEAARAYNDKALEIFGNKARLNDIPNEGVVV